jgi:molybdopterin synthase sulfur carrier subunit
MRTLTVLYFAWLRERVGTGEEQVSVPPETRTVADLVAFLSARSPAHEAAFRNRNTIRCAVNQEFADPATQLGAADEVAFFPPVTGG